MNAERAAEVADLVAAALGPELGHRSDLRDALGGVAQAPDPPGHAPGESTPTRKAPSRPAAAATANARRTTRVDVLDVVERLAGRTIARTPSILTGTATSASASEPLPVISCAW